MHKLASAVVIELYISVFIYELFQVRLNETIQKCTRKI